MTTSVLEIHVVALLVGGGFALAHDRGTLRASSGNPASPRDLERRALALDELGAVHRLVGCALATSIASGTVLFFLHTDRYVTSAVFWIKMALIIGLAANAFIMQIAERGLRERESEPDVGWRRLRGTALASSTLWILVAMAGVVLGQVR